MAIEIERKFLVNHTLWNELTKPEGNTIKQTYLTNDDRKVIRVRVKGTKGFLTIKEKIIGLARPEFEYEIPLADAEELFIRFGERKIDKIRYEIPYGNDGHVWEVDEFFGENEGLILAEIELNDENESFEKPEWITKEVSEDRRYYNMNLLEYPYSQFRETE